MHGLRVDAFWGVVAAAALASCAGQPNVARQQEPTPTTILAAVVPAVTESSASPVTSGIPHLTIGECSNAPPVERFTLAHLNDLQARYSDRIDGRSRYGFISGYLEALQRDVPNTLVLDAGDDYEKGAIAELLSMGETTRQMVQALPIDVRTIGNHDFAYGEGAVLRDVRASRHPVLASNIHYQGASPEGEPEPFVSFVRVDIGCAKVGLVGLVTAGYGSSDYPSRDPFDGVFEQDDHYESVLADLVRKHRGEVDVFIALNHIGYWFDVDLARRVAGIDLVVGGHSEELIAHPTLVRRADGSHAYVVQAGHWGQTLGRADLAVDLRDHTLAVERYAIVNVDGTLPYDENVGNLASSLEASAAPDAHHAVAIVRTPIAQGKPMADVVFQAAKERWGVDAMLIGKDVFWDGLPAGPITAQRLYDTVLVEREPSGTSGFTSVFLTQVTGATLQALRAHLILGPMYVYYAPDSIDAARTYRLAIEKRALENPAMAMYAGGPALGPARYAGELIDLLLAYAKDKTQHGQTLP
jgi:2',3'-cyclic-nucleotide 2'-phosphodiesterase (5'-nucleotidase family)